MITYNPRDWFRLIMMFHKSDTFRRLLPAMIGISLLSVLVVYLEVGILHVKKNVTIVHSILGFVLSMLLVFRTNTAYDRWWEGRKLWGELVNETRNFALKISVLWKGSSDEKKEIIQWIADYPVVLKNHLRNIVDERIFNQSKLTVPSDIKHLPLYYTHEFIRKMAEGRKNGKISEWDMVNLNKELTSWMNVCGACERIKNTPIPFSYNIFLKKIVFIYVVTIPFVFSPDFGYITVLIAPFVLYFFASMELIAEEIEDPFGSDDNDLPLDDICNTIRKNLDEIMEQC